MTYKWKDLVLLFFQGVLIGTGAILPGISGGVLVWPLVFMSP